MRTIIIWIVVLIIILGGGWYWLYGRTAAPSGPTTATTTQTPIASVSYSCDSGKTIDATYYQGQSTPSASPDQPPTPGGSVALTLSDGRTMTLPQTISADGIRYANADESLIFWSRGSGAFVMEGNTQTFANCEQATTTPTAQMGASGSSDQGNLGGSAATSGSLPSDAQLAPAPSAQ